MIKIIDKSDNKSLIFLKNFILKKTKSKLSNFENDLSEIHNYLNKKQINEFRLNLFKNINSLNWKEHILEIISDYIFNVLGQDLLIQTKLNVSIQMPGDQSSILPLHSDSWSADSPFQLNLWIPLTNAFETNSMFIKDLKASKKILKKIANNKIVKFDDIKINKKDFVNIDFGKVLIFNPVLLHGNVLNRTNKTRISLNVRIKSMFAPEPSYRNTDRKFGSYYSTFHISENTKLALDALNTGFLD